MERIAEFYKVSYSQFKKDYEVINGKNNISEDELKSMYDLIKLPKRATTGSAGYDFYLPYPIKLKAGEEEAKLDVIANAISYSHLLTRHIDKEDRVIYKFAERNLKEETMQFVNLECENYEVNNEEIRNKYILLLEELEKKYN